MNQGLIIGRLLRSNITGCVIGCNISQQSNIEFGSMLQIPFSDPLETILYGLVHDMHIDDDGLVKQIVSVENVSEEVILDNRMNRNVPLEISILYLGYSAAGVISHLLPRKPPLVLDAIKKCDDSEIVDFTGGNRFGYLRHILTTKDIPTEEVLAAHLSNTAECHKKVGDSSWLKSATQELIIQLRDEYSLLMRVLDALSDINTI